MTKYLIVSDLAAAKAKSAAIATALGCGTKPEDITRYWFGVYEHPTLKQGIIEVPDNDTLGKAQMSAGERAALADKAVIAAAGWLPSNDGVLKK